MSTRSSTCCQPVSSPHFPSRIRFGSFLVYPSPASTPEAQHAKNLILAVKQDRFTALQPPVTVITAITRVLGRSIAGTGLADILASEATLIPMPKSAPMLRGGVWPSRSICQALVDAALARDWRPFITRTQRCEKAAYQLPGQRPTPRRHYDTMAAASTTLLPHTIVLVDDVVTKGATFAGAAARLLEIDPDLDIRAFAIARTTSAFSHLQVPCIGEIHVDVDGMSAYRRDAE